MRAGLKLNGRNPTHTPAVMIAMFHTAFNVLGVLLMLGGIGYLLNVFGELLIPGYATTALSNYATLPASLGEIGSGLWLTLFGARTPDLVPPRVARAVND